MFPDERKEENMERTKDHFQKNVIVHVHVNVQKHFWKNNFCALHVFLLSLLYQSLDFTISRSLQTFTK